MTDEEKFCQYCCNFDIENIGMDGFATCKISNTPTYAENYSGYCLFYNIPKNSITISILDKAESSKSKCEECAGCLRDKCDYANVRNETIDEFAERLKGEMLGRHCMDFNYEITNAIIDNIAKELKEVDK